MVLHEEAQTRKGPWTEQEDLQLAGFVELFGHRRWDFIAKVSGLKRTGKGCRLRWVNYLRPDLKHGRLTPQEERLVLELHSRWGNRWSRIARKLPGRTDNEIKNYWRTHMRKKAQERHEITSSLSSSTSPSSSSMSMNSSTSNQQSVKSMLEAGNSITKNSICWRGGDLSEASQMDVENGDQEEASRGTFMEDMWTWKDITAPEMLSSPIYEDERSMIPCSPAAVSPLWEYCCDSLWKMDDGQFLAGDPFLDEQGPHSR